MASHPKRRIVLNVESNLSRGGLLLLCAFAMPAVSTTHQNDANQLDRRIGAPNVPLYRSIRDLSDWRNPYLVIRRDGIEVIGSGITSGRRTVVAADLERTLTELPITAWPYGRVVVVQEIGIRAADGIDDKLIAANLEAARAILKTMGVTIERWPS